MLITLYMCVYISECSEMTETPRNDVRMLKWLRRHEYASSSPSSADVFLTDMLEKLTDLGLCWKKNSDNEYVHSPVQNTSKKDRESFNFFCPPPPPPHPFSPLSYFIPSGAVLNISCRLKSKDQRTRCVLLLCRQFKTWFKIWLCTSVLLCVLRPAIIWQDRKRPQFPSPCPVWPGSHNSCWYLQFLRFEQSPISEPGQCEIKV